MIYVRSDGIACSSERFVSHSHSLASSLESSHVKALAVALAAIFFIVAILYGTGVLQIGTHEPGPHLKHAVLFALLGVLSLVWMRFQGKSSSAGFR